MGNALRNRLETILHRADLEDWSDTSFSLMKAHICAELSAIVYEDVQGYELKRASRIHLFASDTYRKIIRSGKPNNILDSITAGDFEAQFFVIRGRYAIVLGTIFKDVLILAVRGTVFRRLWDWKANVDARKHYLSHNYNFNSLQGDLFFHKGFFESIVPHFGSILDEIKKRNIEHRELTVIWTGHSLGGGMAAIGNATSEQFNFLLSRSLKERVDSRKQGAYTFGMPRYGGLGAVCSFLGPHHIYKACDLVPTVPLRRMGFADCPREYELSSSGIVALSERTDTFDLAGHIPRLWSSIRAHAIEGYASALSEAVDLPRP